jgi:hypothetical protein
VSDPMTTTTPTARGLLVQAFVEDHWQPEARSAARGIANTPSGSRLIVLADLALAAAPTAAPETAERLRDALVDDLLGQPSSFHGLTMDRFGVQMTARLDAIIAAARADLDVERLAKALHVAEIGCDGLRCSGEDPAAHRDEALATATAYDLGKRGRATK